MTEANNVRGRCRGKVDICHLVRHRYYFLHFRVIRQPDGHLRVFAEIFHVPSQLLLNQLQQLIIESAHGYYILRPGACVDVAVDRLQRRHDDPVNVRMPGQGTYVRVVSIFQAGAVGVLDVVASGHGVFLLFCIAFR